MKKNSLLIAIVCVAALLTACSSPASEPIATTDEAAPVEQSTTAETSETEEATSEQDEQLEEAQEDSSNEPDVKESTITLDLNSATDWQDLSIFLSNFSETGFPGTGIYGDGTGSYSQDGFDPEKASEFAFHHVYLNDKSLLTPTDDIIYNTLCSGEVIEDVVQRYLGIKPGWIDQNTSVYWDGSFMRIDMTNGWSAFGPAAITGLENIGENLYQIFYETWWQPLMMGPLLYDHADPAFYTLSHDEMVARIGQQPNRFAEAVVEVSEGEGSSRFTLISLNVTDGSNTQAADTTSEGEWYEDAYLRVRMLDRSEYSEISPHTQGDPNNGGYRIEFDYLVFGGRRFITDSLVVINGSYHEVGGGSFGLVGTTSEGYNVYLYTPEASHFDYYLETLEIK